MIASTPVARWTWGRFHTESDTVGLCLRDVLLSYQALATQRLALGDAVIQLAVFESGNPRNLLCDIELRSSRDVSPIADAERLAQAVRQTRTVGEIGAVDATIHCTGEVSGSDTEIIQSNLLRLSTSAYEEYVATDLVTYSDVWMAYDLRGRPQPEVYSANQPRLAAGLRAISKALAAETDPDDPTHFGQPTETGVDNFFDPDGSASNVWHTYEE